MGYEFKRGDAMLCVEKISYSRGQDKLFIRINSDKALSYGDYTKAQKEVLELCPHKNADAIIAVQNWDAEDAKRFCVDYTAELAPAYSLIMGKGSWSVQDGALQMETDAHSAQNLESGDTMQKLNALLEACFNTPLTIKAADVEIEYVAEADGGKDAGEPTLDIEPQADISAADELDKPPFDMDEPAQNVVQFKKPEKKADDSRGREPEKSETAKAGKKKANNVAAMEVKPKTLVGKAFNPKKIDAIQDLTAESGTARVMGEVIDPELKETKRKDWCILSFIITDHYGSIKVIKFVDAKEGKKCMKYLSKRGKIGVRGLLDFDSFRREQVIRADDITWFDDPGRVDDAETKRVELHAHTKMSTGDGLADAKQLVTEAARMGHKAIAITDHGVVQAFPDAYGAACAASKTTGNEIKLIYGIEGYLADDFAYYGEDGAIEDIVVFDIETTGLDPKEDSIIEIGAVRMVGGKEQGSFQTFIDPGFSVSAFTTELTGINDDMLKGAPAEKEALEQFAKFAGNSVLCAHNARFDVSFIRNAGEKHALPFENGVIDTMILARLLVKGSRHSLEAMCKHFGITNAHHHRAEDDARATAELLQKLLEQHPVERLEQLNGIGDVHALKPYHIILLAKDKAGLKNIYRAVTESHLKHFHRKPIIPKSFLSEHREGLIIGSACEQGEVFRSILAKHDSFHQLRIASFYDYLEIQPIGNNRFLIEDDRDGSWVKTEEDLRELNRSVVRLADWAGKPVAATCDSHFINPYDEYYRRILMTGQGFKDAEHQAPLFFRTTPEMLAEFEYLGEEKAREVVIDTPNMIAEQVQGGFGPYPDETFVPTEENGDQLLTDISYEGARAKYGDPLPDIIEKRLQKELGSIIKHGFSTLYLSAYRLVKKSMEDGYSVGSRGSVGSSLVAMAMGISEVNPMEPHYVCPKCKHSIFDTGEDAGSGPDLPDKDCPKCGAPMDKDGFEIPFEVFLGFDGDKVPDIDLNFSGEYQHKAFKQVEEMFGKENVFRAGTVMSIQEKTAYGYVRKYMDEKGVQATQAEIDRLKKGITGVKSTTGRHPAGLVVLPEGMDILDFTPLQHPADKKEGSVITTHFDFNSLHDRLVKLDVLGHDNPTLLRRLYDYSGMDPLTVPLDDLDTLSLFTSSKALKTGEDEDKPGTLGIPEFGTDFVRAMLEETRPTTVGELVRISGLSHGTMVWVGNAQDLIRDKIVTLRECICTRDEIMIYLMGKGVEARMAFNVMESVRKGRGLKPEMEQAMLAAQVPAWYIESCKRISYMFPKAHAAAYVTSALRIAYFKVHHPREYYAAHFSVRGEEMDAENVIGGAENVKRYLDELKKRPEPSTRDKKEIAHLELVYEMNLRGIEFIAPDLHDSELSNFRIEGERIRMPLMSVQGMGETAAMSIVEARKNGPIHTVEDLRERTSVNNTVIEKLRNLGALDEIPDSAQLSFF